MFTICLMLTAFYRVIGTSIFTENVPHVLKC